MLRDAERLGTWLSGHGEGLVVGLDDLLLNHSMVLLYDFTPLHIRIELASIAPNLERF